MVGAGGAKRCSARILARLMRPVLACLAVVAALVLGACSDDDSPPEGDTTGATTGAPAPKTTPSEPPPFSPTAVFSGDEVVECLEDENVNAVREPKPAPDDEVGRGVVHDRLLVGEPVVLRLFMFGAQDLATREGRKVSARSPEAQVLGTVVLEPLRGDTAKASQAVVGCLKKQSG